MGAVEANKRALSSQRGKSLGPPAGAGKVNDAGAGRKKACGVACGSGKTREGGWRGGGGTLDGKRRWEKTSENKAGPGVDSNGSSKRPTR